MFAFKKGKCFAVSGNSMKHDHMDLNYSEFWSSLKYLNMFLLCKSCFRFSKEVNAEENNGLLGHALDG